MDRGAWWATVYRVAKSQTRLKWLSTHAHTGLVSGGFGQVGVARRSLDDQNQGENLGGAWRRVLLAKRGFGWGLAGGWGLKPLYLLAGSFFLVFIKIHLLSLNLTLCQVLYKQTWSLPLRNFQPKTHTHADILFILNIHAFPTLFQRRSETAHSNCMQWISQIQIGNKALEPQKI